MEKREDIAKRLAEELGMKVLPDSGVWIKYKSCQPLRNDIRDALISREMRVRELEAAIRELWPFIHEDEMGLGEMSPFKAAWLKCELALNSERKND